MSNQSSSEVGKWDIVFDNVQVMSKDPELLTNDTVLNQSDVLCVFL
jgi:hypothetical protein